MNEMLRKLGRVGLIPMVRIEDAKDAVPMAKALAAGGIPVAEITFRTDAAEQAMRNIHEAMPEVLLGAGTVLTVEQVDKAIDAGATYIVTPGFSEKVVAHCQDKGIPITPGCATASEVAKAVEMGLEVVKFFPAEAAGGIKMIKALSGPYGKMMFIPTGGVEAANLMSYLSFPKVLAAGGSWMVKDEWISAGEFGRIEAAAREAVETMIGLKLAHIGVNAADEGEAASVANSFAAALPLEVKAGNSSLFAGSAIEVMKSPYLGKHGHIAFSTPFVERAMHYLELRGASFDESTKKEDGKGIIAIYMKGEIGGYAIHLVRSK